MRATVFFANSYSCCQSPKSLGRAQPNHVPTFAPEDLWCAVSGVSMTAGCVLVASI
jgi:hypothetical protein